MPPSQAVDSYRRTQAQASTPLERVVMLYDGAIRFLGVARDAMVRNDIAARRDAISRALAIIGELQAGLDFDHGGEIATSLDRLYGYVTQRLLDATLHKDAKPIEDSLRVLEMLREAWQTIAAQTASAGSAA